MLPLSDPGYQAYPLDIYWPPPVTHIVSPSTKRVKFLGITLFLINRMDSGSISKDSKRIDVPMRSFFPEYYPFLRNLYNQVGIPYAQTDNSMSFATIEDGALDPSSIYQHEGSFPVNCRMDEKMDKSEVSGEIRPYFSFSCHDSGDNLYSLPDLPAFEASWEYVKKLQIILCVIIDYVRLLLLSLFFFSLGYLGQGML
jgi:hypothetical protein